MRGRSAWHSSLDRGRGESVAGVSPPFSSTLTASTGARAPTGLSCTSTALPVSWGRICAPPADEAGLPKRHPRGVAAEAEVTSALTANISTSSFWIDSDEADDEERRQDAGDDVTTTEGIMNGDDGGDDDHDDINSISDDPEDHEEAGNDDAFTVFL